MVAILAFILAGINCFLIYEIVEGNGSLSEAERLQMIGLIGGTLYALIRCIDKLIDKEIK